MTPTVRDRARQSTMAALAEAVTEVFLERGFDAVTVDEAAREAGISRATFFRYFSSKEDAVVVAVSESKTDYAQVLRSLDPRPGENAWTTLRRVFEHGVLAVEANADHQRARSLMIAGQPLLRAKLVTHRMIQVDELSAALAERIADPVTARVLTVAAMSTYDLAWREWAENPSVTFRASLDDLFARLEAGSLPLS